MSSVHCQARVWDSGDMTDCGKLALRASLCPEHLQEEVVSLRAVIKRNEESIRIARERLFLLQTETG